MASRSVVALEDRHNHSCAECTVSVSLSLYKCIICMFVLYMTCFVIELFLIIKCYQIGHI